MTQFDTDGGAGEAFLRNVQPQPRPMCGKNLLKLLPTGNKDGGGAKAGRRKGTKGLSKAGAAATPPRRGGLFRRKQKHYEDIVNLDLTPVNTLFVTENENDCSCGETSEDSNSELPQLNSSSIDDSQTATVPMSRYGVEDGDDDDDVMVINDGNDNGGNDDYDNDDRWEQDERRASTPKSSNVATGTPKHVQPHGSPMNHKGGSTSSNTKEKNAKTTIDGQYNTNGFTLTTGLDDVPQFLPSALASQGSSPYLRHHQQQQQQHKQRQSPRDQSPIHTLPSVEEVVTEDYAGVSHMDSESTMSSMHSNPILDDSHGSDEAMARGSKERPAEKVLVSMREMILQQQDNLQELADKNNRYRQKLEMSNDRILHLRKEQLDQKDAITKLQFERESFEAEAVWLREELKTIRKELLDISTCSGTDNDGRRAGEQGMPGAGTVGLEPNGPPTATTSTMPTRVAPLSQATAMPAHSGQTMATSTNVGTIEPTAMATEATVLGTTTATATTTPTTSVMTPGVDETAFLDPRTFLSPSPTETDTSVNHNDYGGVPQVMATSEVRWSRSHKFAVSKKKGKPVDADEDDGVEASPQPMPRSTGISPQPPSSTPYRPRQETADVAPVPISSPHRAYQQQEQEQSSYFDIPGVSPRHKSLLDTDKENEIVPFANSNPFRSELSFQPIISDAVLDGDIPVKDEFDDMKGNNDDDDDDDDQNEDYIDEDDTDETPVVVAETAIVLPNNNTDGDNSVGISNAVTTTSDAPSSKEGYETESADFTYSTTTTTLQSRATTPALDFFSQPSTTTIASSSPPLSPGSPFQAYHREQRRQLYRPHADAVTVSTPSKSSDGIRSNPFMLADQRLLTPMQTASPDSLLVPHSVTTPQVWCQTPSPVSAGSPGSTNGPESDITTTPGTPQVETPGTTTTAIVATTPDDEANKDTIATRESTPKPPSSPSKTASTNELPPMFQTPPPPRRNINKKLPELPRSLPRSSSNVDNLRERLAAYLARTDSTSLLRQRLYERAKQRVQNQSSLSSSSSSSSTASSTVPPPTPGDGGSINNNNSRSNANDARDDVRKNNGGKNNKTGGGGVKKSTSLSDLPPADLKWAKAQSAVLRMIRDDLMADDALGTSTRTLPTKRTVPVVSAMDELDLSTSGNVDDLQRRVTNLRVRMIEMDLVADDLPMDDFDDVEGRDDDDHHHLGQNCSSFQTGGSNNDPTVRDSAPEERDGPPPSSPYVRHHVIYHDGGQHPREVRESGPTTDATRNNKRQDEPLQPQQHPQQRFRLQPRPDEDATERQRRLQEEAAEERYQSQRRVTFDQQASEKEMNWGSI